MFKADGSVQNAPEFAEFLAEFAVTVEPDQDQPKCAKLSKLVERLSLVR